MFITSWGYIVFLTVAVALLMAALKQPGKSAVFFALNLFVGICLAPKQLPVLIFFCALSYIFGLIVRDQEKPKSHWFFVYLLLTLTVLGFLIKSFWMDLEIQRGFAASVLIPIGFGYVCLQNIGFVLDAKNGEYERFPSFLDFFASSTFFANIVAGPIENLVQLQEKMAASSIDMVNVRAGALRIATGFCKKAISDVMISPLFFSDSGQWLSNTSIAAIPGLLLKFYADFSGSTDIAIGSAQVLGIQLPENFDKPYKSLTMAEYWTRWHRTLGNWFKTYFFYPLQKKILSRSSGKNAFATVGLTLFMTFVLIGLWHGITWNCFIWGVMNAVLVVISPWLVRHFQDRSRSLNALLLMTTLFFTFLGQLLLVSYSVGEFWVHLRRILLEGTSAAGTSWKQAVLFVLVSILLWVIHQYDRRLYQQDCSRSSARYYLFLGLQILFIIIFFKSGTSFLYADF